MCKYRTKNLNKRKVNLKKHRFRSGAVNIPIMSSSVVEKLGT